MFTGIVEHVSTIKISGNTVIVPNIFENPVIGESISVNGTCLTVEKYSEQEIFFTAGAETLSRTNLSRIKYANLERALKVGDRLGGHFVTGHIDGTLRFLGESKTSGAVMLRFAVPSERWGIAAKGSISLNGISLTVASLSLDTFSVQVIPHTYENTNLKYLKYGDEVNYEIDVFARYGRRN